MFVAFCGIVVVWEPLWDLLILVPGSVCSSTRKVSDMRDKQQLHLIFCTAPKPKQPNIQQSHADTCFSPDLFSSHICSVFTLCLGCRNNVRGTVQD